MFRLREGGVHTVGGCFKSVGGCYSIYSITALMNHAKYTSYCLLVLAFALQLVAVFDEVYGFLHYVVSVMFFVSLGFASWVVSSARKIYLSKQS